MLLTTLTSLILSVTCACVGATESSGPEDQPTLRPVELFSEELPIVVIDYHDLTNPSQFLDNSIATAYGASGLGILFVKNVPNFGPTRRKLLHLSRTLAIDVSAQYKENLIVEKAAYNIGWQYGKEKFVAVPDFKKASFYANPIYDDPADNDTDLIEQFASFCHPNVWPHSQKMSNNNTNNEPIESIDNLTIDEFGVELRQAFMSLGGLVYQVGGLLGDKIDAYVDRIRRDHSNYVTGTVANVIKSRFPKGRMLYYFSEQEHQTLMMHSGPETSSCDENAVCGAAEVPEDSEDRTDSGVEDDWSGWHNDISALTGLVLGMYFDGDGNVMDELDASVGSFNVKTRMKETYHVRVNERDANEYLAFQIGQSSQILSGGAVYATPHSVKAPLVSNVSRASFALFMQPRHDHHMTAPNNVSMDSKDDNLPSTVAKLDSVWFNQTNDTFGEFGKRVLACYFKY